MTINTLYRYQNVFLMVLSISFISIFSFYDVNDDLPEIKVSRELVDSAKQKIKEALDVDMTDMELHVDTTETRSTETGFSLFGKKKSEDKAIEDKNKKDEAKDFSALDNQGDIEGEEFTEFHHPSDIQKVIMESLMQLGLFANKHFMALFVGFGALVAVLFPNETGAGSVYRGGKKMCGSVKAKIYNFISSCKQKCSRARK